MSPTANVTPTRESNQMLDKRQMLDILSPALGQLPKSVGDEIKVEVADGAPVHPFVLSFTNLTYAVKTRRKMLVPPGFVISPKENGRRNSTTTTTTETQVLLNNISGEASDGKIMAVLGGSGSGKSTLIDALANRISKDSLKGTITLNREPIESRLLKVISAYVMQDDLLFPMLTVEETLMFAADFRLPKNLSKSQKKLRVQALIDQLGLRNAAKTVIGDEGHRGVSGGERRRVSIGIDIIHDPIILFLDEPTSGLDSTNAFMVVKVLKRIAESGSIVIMSIHQPSYRILGLLDKLIFLSHGHTVFSGSLSNLPQFFADFGYPLHEKDNRIEFALDLIRQLEESESPCGITSLIEFYQIWQQTKQSLYPTTIVSLKEAIISASISRKKFVSDVSNYANPFWIEVVVLSKRSIINSSRMPNLIVQKLGTGFIMATASCNLKILEKGFKKGLGFSVSRCLQHFTYVQKLCQFLYKRDIFSQGKSLIMLIGLSLFVSPKH